MQISSVNAYEKALDQEYFLGVTETRELFKKAFANGNQKRWRLNHSPMFLDFLEARPTSAAPRGDTFVLAVRVAEAVLPTGPLRPREGPALRELYGALRLRAVRRLGHGGLAARVPARHLRPLNRAYPAAPGSARDITLLTRLM
jgi:hypothetical protein